MISALVYIVLCFVIGVIGADRKFGYWGYFFCSLFLTPVIGTLVLLASDEHPKQINKCPNCSYPIPERKAHYR